MGKDSNKDKNKNNGNGGGKNTGTGDGNHDQRQKEKQKAAQAQAHAQAQAQAQATAAAISGAGTGIPTQSAVPGIAPLPSSNYNPSRTYVEYDNISSDAFKYGLSPNFQNKLNLPTSDLTGVSEGELGLILTNMDRSLQYEADYGLRELQGQIDKELAKMQYDNDQLKTDKTLRAEKAINQADNLADFRSVLQQRNASMLSGMW